MKRSRKINKGWVIVGLILIFSLFFVIKTRLISPVAENSPITVTSPVVSPPPVGLPSAIVVTSSPLPPDFPTNVALTLTPTVFSVATSALQPPQCAFPMTPTTTTESMPEKYTFSEPEVVLTDELQPYIVDWLPDNQNVLMMSSKLIDLGINGYQQTIELFNPETKETEIYATRRKIDNAPPVWNPKLNAVIYPATNVLGVDSATNSLEFTRQVMISYGNPDDTKVFADNLPQYDVTVKSDGSQIVYFLDQELFKLDAALKPLSPVPFDRERWDYLHENEDKVAVDYMMAWQPHSSQIFLYNQAYDNLGYTYILDADNGQLCNLSFGGWALVAKWSPNGRYLAIIRAQDDIPVKSTDLAVLDTATGMLYVLDVVELEGGHYVEDIAWASDNRNLFVVGSTFPSSSNYDGLLYLVDFISGGVNRILPSYKFKTGIIGSSLAWSPDSSKLLMNCSIAEETHQVCLISVQTEGQ